MMLDSALLQSSTCMFRYHARYDRVQPDYGLCGHLCQVWTVTGLWDVWPCQTVLQMNAAVSEAPFFLHQLLTHPADKFPWHAPCR